MNYFKKTISSLSWMGGLRASTRAITFVRLAILARLLTPSQFGLFGIATLVLAFLEILTETGINVFFIQNEGDLDDYVHTAWVVSLIRGTLIALGLLILAPFIAIFFNSPASASLIAYIAVIPFIRGFINPAIVSYQKDLHFRQEFFLRLAIFFLDSSVAVAAALISPSATSLIWGLVAGAILEVILSHLLIRPRPRFSFEPLKVKRVLNRGKWVTLAGMLKYLFTSGDNIVVGRVLGTASLGLYDMAYKISLIPITEVADVFGRVLFPTFSYIASDKSRLRQAYFKAVLALSALVIPIGLVLVFFTRPLVLLLLGSQWLSIIPVLKLLSIFGTIRAIIGSSSALFLAVKKQEYVTWITLFNVLGIGLPIIPLVYRYGILGAGISAGIGTLAGLPLIAYYLYRVFRHA